VTGSVVRDADGRAQHLVLQVEDVTAARDAEDVARLRLAQQTAVAWLGQRALAEPDLDALLEAATAVAAATLGVPFGSFMRLMPDGDTVDPITMTGWDVPRRTFSLRETGGVAAAVFAGSGPLVVEDVATETRFSAEGLQANGVASCLCVPVAGEGDDFFGALGVFSSERRAFSTDDIAFVTSVANVITGAMRRDIAARRLRHQSLHDPLTQLPNRSLLLDRLRHGLARAQRDGSTLAVLFCDVDDFKYVNDSLGHDAGDRLLAALAVRLQDALRTADTLARFGGDEFVVLCEGLRDPAEAVRVADRLMEVCREPIDLGAIEHVPTASIGIAIAELDGEVGPEGLLRDADVAMYGAKSHGKGRYEVFDSRMRARTVDRITLTGDLRRAIAGGELELHFQPIVSLRRREVSGLEALVRWRHPARGLLMPATFIGLAEDTGLIHELGRWVVGEAIRAAAAWRRAGTPVLDRVLTGVNVSWRQLAQGTLVEDVRSALAEHALEPGAFCVEVTETALMEEPERARAALAQMRAMGVHLGLDDFGTGHSSLSVLRDFDLDVIKLDRAFVAGSGEWAIINAVREMASSLDLLVVAEGIEEPEQAERVEAIGCDFGQGWLYARPVPAEALPAELVRLEGELRARH
jgi:diguanylate cyclase (GGDEF)-like protein